MVHKIYGLVRYDTGVMVRYVFDTGQGVIGRFATLEIFLTKTHSLRC